MDYSKFDVAELLLKAGSDLFHEDAYGKCASSRAPLTQTYFVLTYRKPTNQTRFDELPFEESSG